MKLPFTKMHGAGNDFIVINGFEKNIELSAEQWRKLADRRFGIGADQILIVGKPRHAANDFSYRIINADGSEVEHCGNGARAFLRYVVDKKLTSKRQVRVEIQPGVIELSMRDDGDITVLMGVPKLDANDVPFEATGLNPKREGRCNVWPLEVNGYTCDIAVVSMGNPHAVQIISDIDAAPVGIDGPAIESHVRFPRQVNAGFMQIVDPHNIKLRVWERGVGETLACGTGACAAVVSGIERGLLASPVKVKTLGGTLEICWAGPGTSVAMSGPAVAVFEGEIEF